MISIVYIIAQVASLVVFIALDAFGLNVGDQAKSGMEKDQVVPLQGKLVLAIDDSAALVPVLAEHSANLMNVITANAKRILNEKKQTNSKGKRRQRKNKRRHKRSRSIHRLPKHLGFPRKACGTSTSYVFKQEAKDIFGDTVSFHPVSKFGKSSVNQFFRETFCSDGGCSCGGIDSKTFTSSCETTHSYMNARTVKNETLGWTRVKVRSGCACIINEKQQETRDLQYLL
ncbi:hypothetical protein DPMN_089631 [Dreissena polymorpha]|uniref:Nerve growth factor-related domain-containing protein n=1 Tax=Dreissena polymorpha TaxID=45954 RepID=A0A9D4KWR6_DREPO|nr:hypothetical protein DPMN_089631 [Dreissena polymorpha]